MAGHAKSEEKKRQIQRQIKNGLLVRAVALYRHEYKTAQGGKPLSLPKVCKQIQDEHYAEMRKSVKLDPMTVLRLVKGGKLKSTCNAKKSWLFTSEANRVIDYALELAARGFPLVMPHFFSGSFLVLFIQKAFFTRILRSWSRQVGKK
jgi:hypothetical protein